VAADEKLTDSMKIEQVAKLNVDTAETDAMAAIAHGNVRLMAVYGFTIEVPGVDESVAKLRQLYGLRMLEGTGDAIKGPQDRLLNENARKYVAQYNQTVISSSPRH
jgi:hypothetical protein